MTLTVSNVDREFDWHDDDNDTIVIKPTAAIAIYTNKYDDIVIRRKAGEYEEDDAIVIIPQNQMKDFLYSLAKEANIDIKID